MNFGRYVIDLFNIYLCSFHYGPGAMPDIKSASKKKEKEPEKPTLVKVQFPKQPLSSVLLSPFFF